MKYCHITLDGMRQRHLWTENREGVTLSVWNGSGRKYVHIEIYPSSEEILLYSRRRCYDEDCKVVRLDDNSVYVAREHNAVVDVPLNDFELKFLEIALHISSNESSKNYFRRYAVPTHVIEKDMDPELASHLFPSRKKGAKH